MRLIKSTMLLAAIFFATASGAAESIGCLGKPGYGDFDFWLGSWEVRDADGKLQGTNEITKSLAGCLITEQWTSTQGTQGTSLNYYNPTTKRWTQNWVSPGSIIHYEGRLDSGAMILKGTIYSQKDGKKAPFKGTWTLLEDGRVRQLFEQFDTEKNVWNVWFDGYYSKQPAKP